MNKLVSIITLGCKQNKYESDCMATILETAGYEVTEDLTLADIYILNTCAVTSEAEKKSRQYIAKFNKLNPKAKIIVCGCASENNLEQFKGKPNVYSIFGTEGKERILEFIDKSLLDRVTIGKDYCSAHTPKKTTTREYLKIQDGCNNFCSYCIIPYLRGRTRSRDLDEILSEAKLLSGRSREIVLTGIDISSFKVDGKPGLGILLDKLRDLDCLIRLGSLEVGAITEEFMKIVSTMPNFAPHFHLSLQSGDDEVLRKMNRKYTAMEYLDKVKMIRKYLPYANLTTDVIVGFAGESEENFRNTERFIEEVGFSFVHIFPYSKRAGTVAYRYEDLPMSIKKDRVDKLEIVNARLRPKYLEKFVGRESTVIIEEKKELFEGFSPEYIRCYTDGKVEPNKQYKIRFETPYLEGMKVKILEEI